MFQIIPGHHSGHQSIFTLRGMAGFERATRGGGSNNLWQIIGFISPATGKWPASKGPKLSWAKHFNRQYDTETFLQPTKKGWEYNCATGTPTI